MKWCKLDSHLPESPQLDDLTERLGEPLAVAYVVRLLAYCARNEVWTLGASAVERVTGWRGPTGKLADALAASGFVMDGPDGKVSVPAVKALIEEYQTTKRVNAERQRRHRSVTRDTDRDAPVTSPVSHAPRGEESRGEEDQRGVTRDTHRDDDEGWHGPAEPPLTAEQREYRERQEMVNRALAVQFGVNRGTEEERKREERQQMVDDAMKRATGGGTYIRRK